MFKRLLTLALAALALSATVAATAADVAPDAFVQKLSTDVIEAVKADKAIQGGDVSRIVTLVDAKVMPNVNFPRMTAAVVGRSWRGATPEQQAKLQAEFKTLLVRTYAGALTQVKEHAVEMRPLRANAGDTEIVVRTLVRGRGDAIQLDYRLEKAGESWKIYDVNVLGVWMVEQYRNSFAQEIGTSGIDGLITKLAEKNKSAKS